MWTHITFPALHQLEIKRMNIKNKLCTWKIYQRKPFIPGILPASQTVFRIRWHIFIMEHHLSPDWKSLVPLIPMPLLHNDNHNSSRTHRSKWGFWICKSEKVLINNRDKGELVIHFSLSLYWLRDKVVESKISEQLYVLLKEKLSWKKLP